MKRPIVLVLVLVLVVVLPATACRRTEGPPTIAESWRWSAPPPAYVGMPAADGDAFAATYGHSVLVLVVDGAVKWRAERLGLRDVAPAFAGDQVLAATDDGVVAFDRRDGRLLWERTLGDRASTPAVVGGSVVVTTWGGRLVALDRWALDLPGPSLGPPAAGGGVVVAAWGGGVLAADAATGAVLWRRDFDGNGTSAPTVVGGLAVLVGADQRAHAIDLRTGKERWSLAMKGNGSPESAPAGGDGLVALADRLGHLVVVERGSGRTQWTADGDGAVVRGGPAFMRGAVALALDDGRLMVATDHGRTFRDPPGRISGLVASAGRVVLATREGRENGLTALVVRPS